MKPIFLSTLVLLLGGCAGEYSFNSNLDSQAIQEYFKPSEVQLFDGSRPTGQYEVLGLVEGNACQSELDGVPASMADARTEARRAAADMKANGLIIKNCVETQEAAAGCYTSAMCVGQAIRLATPKE
ncbi:MULTISPECIES: Rcs stress response system protein RcsF [Shewanella]|uniref:Outer membrane lipoprotein n=1 Tax=Shewanella algae TaxID=38313 RepID=A0A379YJT0_9GAMM|nr:MULTISPECIES: Rcs stress response system protein RcsF [Shewanella]EKT4485958.1 hypothetical protein [Shewanella algae]MBC8797543.1 hypothetical protein [Shewanella algae]MBO2547095.1 hypothetical protein [Shewanella algae]MBO2568718.1 hypothetical protein [Shewanella algae]MBO2581571.1 hypothetical protein [Shewanella algae]